MEATTQQQQIDQGGSNNNNNNKSSNSSSYVCRQTSTRWTPTTEQIRILKELYYINGVRSPSAEQIQKISAKLRQYGKIEGKNVFYWFQNHKARERQKKRLTTAVPTNMTPPPPPEIPLMHHQYHQHAAAQKGAWRSGHHEDPFYYNKCPTATPNFVSGTPSSSAGLMPMPHHSVGQFGKYGYGSMSMEKSFRDCSISQGGPMVQNFVWAGLDPYSQYQSSYSFLEKKSNKQYCYDHETLQQHLEDDQQHEDHQYHEDEDDEHSPGLETLPLFPVHSDHHHHHLEGLNGNFNNYKQDQSNNNSYYGNWYHHHQSSDGFSRASLELTLNSYGCMSPFSP